MAITSPITQGPYAGGTATATSNGAYDPNSIRIAPDGRAYRIVTTNGINGLTDTYIQWNDTGAYESIPQGVSPEQYVSESPEQQSIDKIIGTAQQNRAQNQAIVGQQYDPALWNLANYATGANQAGLQALGLTNNILQGSQQVNSALYQQMAQQAAASNAQQQQLAGQYMPLAAGAYQQNLGALQQYGNAAQTANAADYAAADFLNNQFGQYANSRITPVGYGAPIVSQAAQAQADPASIAAERQALSGLQSYAGGAGNITSQAAQAYADPNAIALQYQTAAGLQPYATGQNALTSQAAQAAADPEAIAAQKSALEQYGALTTPQMTAQERFLEEQARQTEEQNRRAAMDAALRNLQARGVYGSGAEIGAMLGAQQQTSQNRLLQDLGANANAVSRAMNALAGYADTAGNLRQQSFGEQFQTGSAADQMANQNRAAALQALAQQGALGTDIRNSSFNEAFGRGNAADQVAAGNRAAILDALNSSGNLSSNMRNSSFNEKYQAGTAADAIAEFNKQQSLAQQDWADQFNNLQNQQQFQNANTTAQMAQNTAQNVYSHAGDIYNATTGVTNDAYNNMVNALTNQINTAQNVYNNQKGVTATGIALNDANTSNALLLPQQLNLTAQQSFDNQNTILQGLGNSTAMKTGINNTSAAGTTAGLQSRLGYHASQSAIDQINQNKSLLGKLIGGLL